jgi:uncharacterized membrane protein
MTVTRDSVTVVATATVVTVEVVVATATVATVEIVVGPATVATVEIVEGTGRNVGLVVVMRTIVRRTLCRTRVHTRCVLA